MEKLTKKQELFCYEYIKDFNGSKAAIRAGYSEKSSRNIAAETLAKPYIQKFIEKISNDIFKSIGLRAERVIHEIVNIAFNEENPSNTRIKALEILLERFSNESITRGSIDRERSAERILNALRSVKSN